MTPGQAACIAWNGHYAEQHGIEARNEWAASDPRGRDAWEAAAKAGHEVIAAAQQSAPAREDAGTIKHLPTGATRADEFARVKVKLCALVDSLDKTVEHGGVHAEEFDQGAAHASAVTARQLRAILDETALTAEGTLSDVRPRADGRRGLDITCGKCGEDYGTNVPDVDNIECPECEAHRCPHCRTWYGGNN